MYSISPAFRQELENDNRAYLNRLVFTFSDSTTLTIDNSDIWEGGVKYENAVSSDSEFQVGSAIVNKLSITLNNITDKFVDYSFEGATVAAYVGLELNNGTTEMIRRGTYIVDSVNGLNASLLKLECLDYMTKFDVPYSRVSTVYPATLATIVADICATPTVNVTLQTAAFEGGNYVVAARPMDSALTCRQVLEYAAQIACKFARMDALGRLCLEWYNVGANATPDHSFSSIYNISSSQYNVAITGVKVTEEFYETETSKKGSYFFGNEGYVIDISGNQLIQSGQASTVARLIGAKLIGVVSFKTVSATLTSDPSLEAGDTATITDEKGREIFCLAMRVTFEPGNSMGLYCSAKTPVRNSMTMYNQLSKTIADAYAITEKQISDYDQSVLQLNELASESFGVFTTKQEQADGSVIYIRHNKPTLADSDIQWKMVAGALMVSSDYGETWSAGIDAQGNAAINVLNAVGVSASWIKTGQLQVTKDGAEVFFIDKDAGVARMSGKNVYIGTSNVEDAIENITAIAQNYELVFDPEMQELKSSWTVSFQSSSQTGDPYEGFDSTTYGGRKCMTINYEATDPQNRIIRYAYPIKIVEATKVTMAIRICAPSEDTSDPGRWTFALVKSDYRYQVSVRENVFPVGSTPVWGDINTFVFNDVQPGEYYIELRCSDWASSMGAALTDVSCVCETYQLSEYVYAGTKYTQDSIVSTVKKDEFASYLEQYYDHVIIAFNDHNKYMQFDTYGLSFYENDNEEYKVRMKLSYDLLSFWKNGNEIGRFDTGMITGGYYGLGMRLEPNGHAITLGYRVSGETNSRIMFTMQPGTNGPYSEAGLHFAAKSYFHNDLDAAWYAVEKLNLKSIRANGYTVISDNIPYVSGLDYSGDDPTPIIKYLHVINGLIIGYGSNKIVIS